MDTTEKIIIRLTQDTIVLLQALVDKGEYDSLSATVSDAIQKLIDSKFTPKEISKLLNERVREEPVNIESLLTDADQISIDEAVKKAVTEYIKSRMGPEE